jgi:hypothetical protein
MRKTKNSSTIFRFLWILKFFAWNSNSNFAADQLLFFALTLPGIIVYFDVIGRTEVCPVFKSFRTHGVANLKPSPIIVYDYYDNCEFLVEFLCLHFVVTIHINYSSFRKNFLQFTHSLVVRHLRKWATVSWCMLRN